jgi:hypothetical protein
MLFTPDVLLNYLPLKRFLGGEVEAEQIKTEATNLEKPLAYGRWRIVWLVVALPYYFIVSCWIGLAKELAIAAGAHDFDFSKRCFVIGRHYDSKIKLLFNLITYEDKLLCPTFNASAWGTEDVYLQSKMSRDQITDKEVLRYLKPLKEIDFYSPEGVCHGMIDWFLNLYDKTYHYFADREEHLIAVAKQFMDGAPRQATFLQVVKNVRFLLPSNKVVEYSKSALNQSKEKIEQGIAALSPGVYGVYIFRNQKESERSLHGHGVLYIKTDAFNSYVFDPNHGLIKCENAQEVQTHFLNNYRSETFRIEFNKIECGKVAAATPQRTAV